MSQSLADEDSNEYGEEDEEGHQHLMVKLLEFQQGPHCYSQKDVDVEEELKFYDVQLLQLGSVFEYKRVYFVTAEDKHAVYG